MSEYSDHHLDASDLSVAKSGGCDDELIIRPIEKVQRIGPSDLI